VIPHHYTAPDAQQIAEARVRLAQSDPALAVAHAATPQFAWRVRPGGFAGLVRLIIEQQVSVASAAAIWGRLEAGLGAVNPGAVTAAGEAALRPFGLSGGKARYVAGLARAVEEGRLEFGRLPELEDEAAISVLCQMNGVGRWTAEAYLLFCEGRMDVLPSGDIALQHALRFAAGLEAKPSGAELQARGEGWRPYRGVATHLLWAFYGGVRRKEIVLSRG
jgi:DNA-3-methyladenine glycosylase II